MQIVTELRPELEAGKLLHFPTRIPRLLIIQKDGREHDWAANRCALKTGERIFSSFKTKTGTNRRVITEANRPSSCLLLPAE